MAGLIGFALAGGAQGVGEGGAKAAGKWMESTFEDEKQKALALRETNLARLRGQIQAESQQRGFEHDTARQESSQRHAASEGALNRAKPKELLDYYTASAKRLNAEAKAIEDGLKYRPKADKPALPNIKVEKDQDGSIYNVDTASGAIGVIVPGQPAKKGETRWFGPNDADTPATAPTIQWSLHGKPLSGGLGDLYPAIRGRAGGSGGAEQPSAGDIAGLKARRNNPQAVAAFERKFGAGSAAQHLGGGAPAVGTVVDGFKFKGGDPNDRPNWQPVSASSSKGEAPRKPTVPELVTTQAQASPKEKHSAAMTKLKAENAAHYSQRIADSFRDILRVGRYTPDDRPFLALAIERGALGADEKKIATEMLEKLSEREFAAGYERAPQPSQGFAR